MGHDIIVCNKCGDYIMESSHGNFECDKCGAKYKQGKLIMSDAISEIEKESNQLRLKRIDQTVLINDAKTYFSFHKENYNKYLKCKSDLLKLGYVIEEDKQLKIYKEF